MDGGNLISRNNALCVGIYPNYPNSFFSQLPCLDNYNVVRDDHDKIMAGAAGGLCLISS